MTQKISILSLSILATAALVAERFVTAGGATATAAGNAVGVTTTSAAAAGALVTCDVLGTTVVTAGAAIAIGDAIEVGAVGKAVVLPSLRASAVLDYPSIAAAASAELTIAVPGAAVGDGVALGLPAAPAAGLVFNAYVSAAGVVTVRASNITGLAVDAGAASYSVAVVTRKRVGYALQAAAADGDRIEVLLIPN